MNTLNKNLTNPTDRPVKVVQFGEGNFLRGFVDWMIQKLNDSGKFSGNVVVVQPIENGMCDMLSKQNCLYTHIIRGSEGVEKTLVNVISRCVKPYDDYEEYLKLAENPDLRFVFSNTTEAGISYNSEDKLDDAPQASFPAKLTALLYKRFTLGLKGLLIFPCELIEKNGSVLKEIILKYADDWKLGEDFVKWINEENSFFNTLVDRIVTGYPKDEKIDLGYKDNMVNTSEYFHLWVIEGDMSYKDELPFDEVGLNVIWTNDLQKYRTRKVRILNGAHTSLVPYAMLRGFDTVKSCIDNEDMLKYITNQLESEENFIIMAHNPQKVSSHIVPCLGWHTYQNSNQYWHVGGVSTFRSSLIFNKKRRIGLIVMGNAKGLKRGNVHYIAKQIYSEINRNKIKLVK